MVHRWLDRAIAGALGAAGVLGMGGLVLWAGGRVNTTGSIPKGLYWVTDAPLQRGAYVWFCPPPTPVFEQAKERGYLGPGPCAGGYGHMMKRVQAVAGDAVSFELEGIRVNGEPLADSAPRRVDLQGRPLLRFETAPRALGPQELLLMGEGNPDSFDARYYGLVDRAYVRAVIKPVLTW